MHEKYFIRSIFVIKSPRCWFKSVTRGMWLCFFTTGLLITSMMNSASAFDFSGQKVATQIDAENGIVCDQVANKCIASGHVRVNRGQALLRADQLTAFFKDKKLPSDAQKIARFEAAGHVIVTMGPSNENGLYSQRATAERAKYDMEKGELVLLGRNLKIESDGLVITAQDSLHYFEKSLTATALGHAVAERIDQKITADQIKVTFIKINTGKLEVDQFFADGHVTVTTPHETIVGQHGTYNETTGIIILEQDVRIHHHKGSNGLKLHGQRAEINMKTGQSRLLPGKDDKGEHGRVKMLLIPDSA